MRIPIGDSGSIVSAGVRTRDIFKQVVPTGT